MSEPSESAVGGGTGGSAGDGAGGGRRRLVDLPVSIRILLSVVVTALAGIVAAVVALVQLDAGADRTQDLYQRNLRDGVTRIAAISQGVRDVRLDMFSMAASADDAVIEAERKAIVEGDARLDAELEAYGRSAADPAGLAEFRRALDRYRETRAKYLMPLALDTSPDAILKFDKASRTHTAALVAELDTDLARLAAAEDASAARSLADARTSARQARMLVIIVLVAGIGAAVAAALMVARGISTTTNAVGRVAAALRGGDLRVRSGVRCRDELGRMAADLDEAADALRRTVSGVAEDAAALATSAEALSSATGQISDEATRSSEQAGLVASSSTQVGGVVEGLSGAAEQLGVSIREIASNAAEAARTAEAAGGEVTRIQAVIAALGESSARIGTVVNLISSIAEQTNLLALNATIEAARAGESGKGFAVVAGEVKDLASQTAQATTEISEQVEAIQRDVAASVEAIGRIVSTVADINALQTTIAGAVEEQTATTLDISLSVAEAVVGTESISETISEVADATTNTSASVSQARSETDRLARMAAELRQLTSSFSY